MIISLIVAAGENNAIGKNNHLPWRLPDEMRHFKNTTMGHPVIMGRKTFESNDNPLPGRLNIVITRNMDFQAKGCAVVHSLDEALKEASKENIEEVFVIGGEEIFRQALPIADRLYLTRVHYAFEGDTFFPAFDQKEWVI